MKILLCAINSKYIHSSLSVRCLYSYAYEFKNHMHILEITINNKPEYTLKKIFEHKPNVICFSCYIWNISYVKDICQNIRLVLPDTIIVLGGPEVSFPPYDFSDYCCDIICIGEGEITFKEIVREFLNGNFPDKVRGIAYNFDGETYINPRNTPLDLNDLPFVYENTNLPDDKIVYYESSRGCPYNCSYCLSSIEEGIRFLDIEKVYKHIDYFLNKNIRQVKFVDRTFNCLKSRAFDIWDYIIKNDNGITNFHFEIAADLLGNRQIERLREARAGLIQFEAGVQSTNPATIQSVLRQTDLCKLFENVKRIKSAGNIHMHLDLIAGLPCENYSSFRESFNKVFDCRPDMLQLGFLKLLKGSNLREKANFAITYNKKPPYEILYTKELAYDDILKLKSIENILEIYYNSGLFLESIEYAIKLYPTAFDFFESFARYWEEKSYHELSHKKPKLYDFLYDFISEKGDHHRIPISNLLKFDMFMNENIKNLPYWAERTNYSLIKNNINIFFSRKENRHINNHACHIERFRVDILKWQELKIIEQSEKYYIFIYNNQKYNKIIAYEIDL